MVQWRDPISILRLLEFIFVAVTLGIDRGIDCSKYSYEKVQFVDGITIAYVIIASAALIALLIGETPGIRSFALIALVGGVVYIAAGVIIIQAGTNECQDRKESMFAAGVCALLAGIAYLIDVYFSVRSLDTTPVPTLA